MAGTATPVVRAKAWSWPRCASTSSGRPCSTSCSIEGRWPGLLRRATLSTSIPALRSQPSAARDQRYLVRARRQQARRDGAADSTRTKYTDFHALSLVFVSGAEPALLAVRSTAVFAPAAII